MVELVKRLSLWIFLGLLAYMPLHIFLSTWIGSSLNILEFTKVAKDGVLLAGFLMAFTVSLSQTWFRLILRDRLTWLIVAYCALTTLLALVKFTDQDAEILGVVYNTRFLVFFLYGILLAKLFNVDYLKKRALQVVLGVASLVLFFGILQYTILPNDALKHVGYERANGVLPAFFIDDKPDLKRVMSTLRDPNSFGSYIIIIASLAGAIYLAGKNQGERVAAKGFLLLSLLCIIFTFSRSAWLGVIFAVITLFAISKKAQNFVIKYKKRIAIIAITLLFIVSAGGWLAKDSYLFQNVVFHADDSTELESSNELRSRFFRESVEKIGNNPLGHGPGTAGLASIRNNKQGTVLNENYYLQIGHEVGVIGLVLFLTILIVVGARLIRINGALANGLLASFIGLAITNSLVHIWSGEAVAYTWWGLAGLIVYNPNKRK